MPSVDALGYAAASLTTLSFVPQAAKTLRSGDTAAISLRMYLLFTSGVALWGAYGLMRGDRPLMVANAITLVSAGLILQSKLRAVLTGKRSLNPGSVRRERRDSSPSQPMDQRPPQTTDDSTAQSSPPGPALSQPLPPPALAAEIKTYRKRAGTQVFAIQLNLDCDSFTYHKWGGLQTCKRGDWIVEHNGTVHTVAAEAFARTYKKVAPATYVKHCVVWAAPTSRAGAIPTFEGATHYKEGDVLVWNDKERTDGYAMTKEMFESLYEPAPASDDLDD